MADTILFQDKGVMQSNINEVIRAHQVAANRVIAVEKKVADIAVGDGSDFEGLKTKLDDLTEAVTDLKTETDKTKTKLDQLFPDEQQTPDTSGDTGAPTPPPSEEDPGEAPTPTPEP